MTESCGPSNFFRYFFLTKAVDPIDPFSNASTDFDKGLLHSVKLTNPQFVTGVPANTGCWCCWHCCVVVISLFYSCIYIHPVDVNIVIVQCEHC